jgi:UbiA prenyltransferase family
MGVAARRPVSFATLLRLGRVSNLPTVWTNVLAGTVLAGAEWESWRTGAVLLAMTLFYVGGMYLNDYFDRSVDARERPERPIPAGDIAPETVAAIGFGLLFAGVVLLFGLGVGAAISGVLLAVAIVGYDAFHKGNPLAPLVMGLCRALIYGTAAAAAVASVTGTVWLAALALLAYVAGLTYAARQENLDQVGNLWPLLLLAGPIVLALPAVYQGPIAFVLYLMLVGWTVYGVYLLAKRPMAGAVSRAVGFFIAGVSLVDAALLASAGAIPAALIATAGFAATLALQRSIAGT